MLTAAADASLRDGALVALMYVSALRVTEVTRADVTDLRWEQGRCILQVKAKCEKVRDVVIDPSVCHFLSSYLAGRTTGPLILANDGDRLGRDQVTRILRRVARAAGLDARRPCGRT